MTKPTGGRARRPRPKDKAETRRKARPPAPTLPAGPSAPSARPSPLVESSGPAAPATPAEPKRLADLLPRILSSLVLMAAALGSIWAGGDIFAFIWLLATGAIAYEWQALLGPAGLMARIAIAAPALVLATQFANRGGPLTACAIVIAAGLLMMIAASGRRGWAFVGMIYAGALMISVSVLLHSTAFGPKALIWLFAVVWGCDVFAYFGGRLIGGPKIWPKLSPSKTWSGTLIGLLGGALLGAAIGFNLSGQPMPAIRVFGLGVVVAMISQAGDVFESWVKRNFGVKDSSVLIPGHGGFMDRLDGFVAAATFMALVGALRHLL